MTFRLRCFWSGRARCGSSVPTRPPVPPCRKSCADAETDLTLRSDALTDRALLLLDNGRRALSRREWQPRPPADLEPVRAVRKDAELHELWDREYGRADDD